MKGVGELVQETASGAMVITMKEIGKIILDMATASILSKAFPILDSGNQILNMEEEKCFVKMEKS